MTLPTKQALPLPWLMLLFLLSGFVLIIVRKAAGTPPLSAEAKRAALIVFPILIVLFTLLDLYALRQLGRPLF